MAVNGKNNDQQTNMGHAFDQAQQQQAQQTSFGAQQQQGFQNYNTNQAVNPFAGIGISQVLADYGQGGEDFERIFTAIRETLDTLKQQGDKRKFSAHKILDNKFGLEYSGIILALQEGAFTTVHTLMIEATGEYPERASENFGNGYTVDILQTPSMVANKRYMDSVSYVIQGALKVDANTIRSTDFTLVPRELKTVEASALTPLIHNALNAIATESQLLNGSYTGVSIKKMLELSASKFVAEMDFNGDASPRYDAVGMPVRQDVRLKLSLRQHKNKTNGLNQARTSLDLVNVYGYIDFEYQTPEVINGIQQSRCFIPNFVVTNVDSPNLALTPDLLILAMMELLTLSENSTWVESFLYHSATRKGEVDYNDIGNLNIVANVEGGGPNLGYGEPLNQNAKDFNAVILMNFVNKIVVNRMIFSFDIPQAGPNTWYLSVLKYAMNNKVEAQNRIVAAINRLGGAGDLLEDGGIRDTFHSTVPMFVNISNKIFGGYFRDKDEMYDIRKVSTYLGLAAHLKATGQSFDNLRLYTDTMQNANISPMLRARNREGLVRELCSGREVIKQYVDRVILDGRWLEQVSNYLRVSGLHINLNNDRSADNIFINRGTDFFGAGVGPGSYVTGQNVYNGGSFDGGYGRFY